MSCEPVRLPLPVQAALGDGPPKSYLHDMDFRVVMFDRAARAGFFFLPLFLSLPVFSQWLLLVLGFAFIEAERGRRRYG